MLYEFCVGRPPYYQKDLQSLYSNISQGPLQLPRSMSLELKDLLTRLLCRVPTERLGVNGAGEIKKHSWFNDIEWEAFSRYNSQGGFDGIFVPRQEKRRIRKKKRQEAQEDRPEIADDPGMRPDLRIFGDIEDWNFVRSD